MKVSEINEAFNNSYLFIKKKYFSKKNLYFFLNKQFKLHKRSLVPFIYFIKFLTRYHISCGRGIIQKNVGKVELG